MPITKCDHCQHIKTPHGHIRADEITTDTWVWLDLGEHLEIWNVVRAFHDHDATTTIIQLRRKDHHRDNKIVLMTGPDRKFTTVTYDPDEENNA